MLLYDGIHYDPLVMADGDGNVLQTTFPLSNEAVLFEALEIASQANKVHIIYYNIKCTSLSSPVYFKHLSLRAFSEQFPLILKWVELLNL